MSSLIKDFMTKQILTSDVNDTVFAIAKVMAQDPEAMGYVIVLEQGKPIGIVTERDIVHKVIAQKANPVKASAASIMSTPLITIDPDAGFLTAADLMQEHQVSKLVVVKNSILYGVITAKIIAAQCSTYINQTVREMIRWTSFGF
jgi:CBS domain-containing protein